jgi:ubiquinone/menaquinone biosynthesis C-methylase UbiE
MLLGYIMNAIHAGPYSRIVQQIKRERLATDHPISILDVGCGGGKAIQLFCKHIETCKGHGIDHSNEMIQLAKRTNRKYIHQNRARIVQGDVSNLPFPSSSYDVVSAFDTMNLWQNIGAGVGEIHRVLKPDGIFVIVNGYPKEGSKWWRVVQFKSKEQYTAFLETYGFIVLRSDITKSTIALVCKKRSHTSASRLPAGDFNSYEPGLVGFS